MKRLVRLSVRPGSAQVSPQAVVAGITLVVMFGLLVIAAQPVQALPEYASQFIERCATCHVSAAGGGPRSPRGQAWVWNWMVGRQGAVPDLEEAFDILGVKLSAEPGFYTDVTQERPEARLSAAHTTDRTRAVLDWLLEYQGN